MSEISIERIRNFTPETFDAYRHLIYQLPDPVIDVSEEDFKEMLEEDNTYLLMASVEEAEMIGMAVLNIQKHPVRKGDLAAVVVDETHRNRHIGRILCQEAQKIAFDLNLMMISATVDECNSAVMHMLRNVQFTDSKHQQKLTYKV